MTRYGNCCSSRGFQGSLEAGFGARMTRPLELRRAQKKQDATTSVGMLKAGVQRGASIVPAKDRIGWPYVALVAAVVMMIAGTLICFGLGRLCDLRCFVGVC